ncbi:MAG: polyisoprenoid-binding protein YceI [Candidatus Binatia bacterium]|jgi:polyisoprenoid-binding protein YceI
MRKPSLLTLLGTAVAVLSLAASPATADVVSYTIDNSHSSVQFKIRHLLSKTSGQFGTYEGTFTLDPDKRDSVSIEGNIDVASIDTRDEDRDKHLREADFFDVEKFPKITFKASELTDVNDDRTKGKLNGSLTMHGVTKPVILDVEWYGTTTDPWGNKKAGFAGFTTLNRKDFGIVWNKALDAGGFVVGEEVEIEIQIEANLVEAEE